MEFISYLVDISIYIVVSILISSFFYFYLKKEILFGFLGGFIFAFFGAVAGVYLTDTILKTVINFLMNKTGNVNVISALLGSYLALYIYNKINHDKQKKIY